MTAHSWRSLSTKKYQFSLRLFLFLNLASALFTVFNPLFNATLTLPGTLIIMGCTVLLLVHCFYSARQISIPGIAFVFGCLWAWYIQSKAPLLNDPSQTYLLIALFAVLFIGAIAFSGNLLAFALHSAPVLITCLILSEGRQWHRMLYCYALPLCGIALQEVIQRRYDSFAQELMFQLLEERKALNDLSMLDPLTGLYNRRGLKNQFETLMSLESQDHFVLLLDIDNFKAYNDHYGHMMGDQALIQISAAIRDAVRSRDIVVRYGGEEFLVLLVNICHENALQTAERIRQRVYDLKIPHRFNQNVATNVTVSIGVAPLHGQRLESALELADRALYVAKRQGRNTILPSENLSSV